MHNIKQNIHEGEKQILWWEQYPEMKYTYWDSLQETFYYMYYPSSLSERRNMKQTHKSTVKWLKLNFNIFKIDLPTPL